VLAFVVGRLRLGPPTLRALNAAALRLRSTRPLELALDFERELRVQGTTLFVRELFFRQLFPVPLPRAFGRAVVDMPEQVVHEPRMASFGEEIPYPGAYLPVPSRYVAEIRNATLVGSAIAVFRGRTLLAFASEYEYPQAYEPLVAQPHPEVRFVPALYRRPNRRLDRGILCALPAAENLFHFTYHCAPRVLLADRYARYDGLPLLVPDWLPPQLLELLDLVNAGGRPIAAFGADDIVRVDRLVVPWIPHVWPSDPLLHHRAMVDVAIAAELRALVAERLDLDGPGRGDVVYFSRGGYVRSFEGDARPRDVANNEEIEEHIRSVGGRVVYPEQHTLAEQIEIWNGAAVAVVAAGAAAANILYARPGARVLVLCQRVHTAPRLFGAVAHAIGVDAALVTGDVVARPYRIPSQHDFTIELDDLRAALHWAREAQ
jgi:capsular polysaccharide biosynthesis protein